MVDTAKISQAIDELKAARDRVGQLLSGMTEISEQSTILLNRMIAGLSVVAGRAVDDVEGMELRKAEVRPLTHIAGIAINRPSTRTLAEAMPSESEISDYQFLVNQARLAVTEIPAEEFLSRYDKSVVRGVAVAVGAEDDGKVNADFVRAIVAKIEADEQNELSVKEAEKATEAIKTAGAIARQADEQTELSVKPEPREQEFNLDTPQEHEKSSAKDLSPEEKEKEIAEASAEKSTDKKSATKKK